MKDLIKRLEAAAEGSYELDEEVDWKLFRSQRYTSRSNCYRWPNYVPPPKYTRSLDAALTLVPEGWHLDCLATGDKGVGLHNPTRRARALIIPDLDNDAGWRTGMCRCDGAAAPALALCIAALKARLALGQAEK